MYDISDLRRKLMSDALAAWGADRRGSHASDDALLPALRGRTREEVPMLE